MAGFRLFGVIFTAIHLVVGASAVAAEDIYLVTGATGRTGQIMYESFRAAGLTTRALVTNITTARTVLGCELCDASEGVYLGDVTNASSLVAAMDGVSFVADAVGVSGANISDKTAQLVEWKGVENQIAVLAKSAVDQGRPLSSLQFAMISSMGTTDPEPQPFMGGNVLFWKLQAEAFIMSSGVPFTIVKPCGLSDAKAAQVELDVGHDDYLMSRKGHIEFGFGTVSRGDVARVMVQALTARHTGLRFDLCSTTRQGSSPTTDADLDALLDYTRWSWVAKELKVADLEAHPRLMPHSWITLTHD